jgi:MFS transporter, DHA3 family, macrolide efflux protein
MLPCAMLKLLVRRADLGRLWLGEVVSQIGDSVFQIALLWMTLELTGSSALTGLVAMSSTLPMLVFGLFAGALADRIDRRRLMLAADLGRAALVLLLPLLYAAGRLDVPVLVVVTLLMAVLSAHFNPARDALVPALVPAGELRAANAWIQSGWQLAMLAGPGLAGLLIPLTGEVQLFTVDGLSFLLSFALIWMIRARPERPAAAPTAGAALRHALADVREGLAHAASDRRLRVLLWITAVDNLFIMGPAIVGVPIFVRQVLGGGPQDYAYLLTAFAFGMLAGTLLLGWLGGRVRNSRLLLWGIVLDGITFLPLAWTTSWSGAYATILIHSLAIPLIIVPRPTLVQLIVPPRLHGRVFSMISVAVTGLTAISVGLTGLIAEWVPMPTIYGAIAVLAALTGGAGWLVREFREGP